MGGPIDTRKAPTEVNTVATQRPFAWFEQNVIATVPYLYPGGGRKVYPGFLQLAGFMAMNFGNHMVSHWGMFRHLVEGDGEGADATKDFYDEYRAVCDMTEEFYLQTIDVVFQRHALPKGEMMHRGRRVDPGAITDVALLAIEGERDDISDRQTRAALDISTGLEAKQNATTVARASAITASSTAPSGATRSRRSSSSGSPDLPERAFSAGGNCWRIERADRAALVVDAADYFDHARRAMLQARHRIMLIGWDFDARIRIGEPAEDGGPEAIGRFILGSPSAARARNLPAALGHRAR